MLKINKKRLWQTLCRHGEIGATEGGGLNRLCLSEADVAARDLFRAWCDEAGCQMSIDQVGNMFALWPGQDPSLDAIAIGSHLDTQAPGGLYDGVLGVLSGLELVRTLRDANVKPNRSICIVNWTNEEGARFQPALLASGVWAGVIALNTALHTRDNNGVSFKEALETSGYAGEVPAGDHSFHRFLELHIEQGPVLDANNKQIGVVQGVQAMRWFEVVITGQESHAGNTPMNSRRDPVAFFAKWVQEVFAIAEAGFSGLATIGRINPAEPNSINVIPKSVSFSLDLRHQYDDQLALMIDEIKRSSQQLELNTACSISMSEIWDSPATVFDERCIEAVRQATRMYGYSSQDIVSGAGHDSVYVSRRVPTSMIFVPCKDGLSHNEAESITPEQAEAGANVLLQSVLIMANAE